MNVLEKETPAQFPTVALASIIPGLCPDDGNTAPAHPQPRFSSVFPPPSSTGAVSTCAGGLSSSMGAGARC